jgi:hypothetical protein
MVNGKAEHWRQMAEECRVCAETMHSDDARRGMRQCAAGYDRMAEQAEHTLERSAPNSFSEFWSAPIGR